MLSPTKFCLGVLMTWSAIITGWNVAHQSRLREARTLRDSQYTYIGTDFPAYHPLINLEFASMTLQESVHYGLNASDAVAGAEWETLNEHPGGFGRAHLGPHRRSFLMTFYHQLHCVRELQRALLDHDDKSATPHHVNHCIQYLRQTFLCGGVDTVEKGDFMQNNYQTQRVASEMICWDWETIYGTLDDSWLSFTEWRSRWN